MKSINYRRDIKRVADDLIKDRQHYQLLGLKDGALQGIALCIWILATNEKYRWGKKRLKDYYELIQDALHMGDVFGKNVYADDTIEVLKERHDIDVEKLDFDCTLRRD